MRLLAVLIALSACSPIDTEEITKNASEECRSVVEETVQAAMESCAVDAWELCNSSYETILAEMKREYADTIAAVSEQAKKDADSTVYVWMYQHNCWWNSNKLDYECPPTSEICLH